MANDSGTGFFMRLVQRLVSYIGIGIVSTEDENYEDICTAYRQMSAAYRRADFTAVLTNMDRDFHVTKPDGVRMKRAEVEEQLRNRFQHQIETDYREEPAHVIIRGRRAQIASRIYSRTLCRRGDKVAELTERGENLTVWVKMKSGWKRESTRVRSHEQNIEWVTEPVVAPARTEKYLA